MNLLTVNVGSSSIRLTVFLSGQNGLRKLAQKQYVGNENTNENILKQFLQENSIPQISAVVHRVVHGGNNLTSTCFINKAVEDEIKNLFHLAPLHNPLAYSWIQLCKKYFSENTPQIAVFDTAFFATLPKVASTYALPSQLCNEHKIRRYGFHGLAHKYMNKRWQELNPELDKGGKIITLQLGAGCSVSAIKSGWALDTSMGFSPLEGLVMASRCGDLDPAIILYLQRNTSLSVAEIDQLLNNASGLLGISGVSKDMRILLESDVPQAKLAIEIFCYRIIKYIGAYMNVLEGIDGIVFGGGIGENSYLIRNNILSNMQWCGIVLDWEVNKKMIGEEGKINSPQSKVQVWIIPVNEDDILAQEGSKLINKSIGRLS